MSTRKETVTVTTQANSVPNSPDVNSDPTLSEDNSVTTQTDSVSADVSTDSDSANSADANSAENAQVNLDPGKIDPNFYSLMRAQVEGMLNEHNSLAAGIKAAGDRVALKDALLENPEKSNDEEFVNLVSRRNELSDALEAAEKQIAEKAEPFIQEHLKRSGVEEKQNKADEIAKAAKATLAFFSAMGASTDGLPTLTGRTKSTSATGDGRGAGTPKYRDLIVYVDGKIAEQKVTVKGKNGEPDQHILKSNLTYGAQAANVPNDVFREAFIKAQGTKDAGQFKDRVEFTVTDGNGKSHDVVVAKKAAE